jgi:hypothetical protein
MSVVTTQPEMVTSVPSTSNVGLPDGGLADFPRDGAGIDQTSHTVPRRRPQSHSVETSDVETSDRISEPA